MFVFFTFLSLLFFSRVFDLLYRDGPSIPLVVPYLLSIHPLEKKKGESALTAGFVTSKKKWQSSANSTNYATFKNLHTKIKDKEKEKKGGGKY